MKDSGLQEKINIAVEMAIRKILNEQDAKLTKRKERIEKPKLYRFDEFWAEYPKARRKSKPAAEAAWIKYVRDDDSACLVLNGLMSAKKLDERFKTTKYTPLPATWLNARGWEDQHESDDKPKVKQLI